ncbi:MAG: glycoside hydrolase family 99-like domain-containing protein [Candidatus Hadarchaeales archaeon]
MLGAYYYLWYGRRHSILGGGDWSSGYSHHPVLGEYDSRDLALIETHVNWAREAGIDFFAINWTGEGAWEDNALKSSFLPVAEKTGFKFCLVYDSYFNLNKLNTRISYDFNGFITPGQRRGEKFLSDLAYLESTYFRSPSYLKIDGRPLLIIYAVREFRNAQRYLEKWRSREVDVQPFTIADVVFWSELSISDLKKPSIRTIGRRLLDFLTLKTRWKVIEKYFDGITGYCMYDPRRVSNFLNRVKKEFRKFHKLARESNLSFVPSPMPGYDDRNLRGYDRPVIPRSEQFYREFFRLCCDFLDDRLGMVVITSFNEWHEGTEIEPSKEFGDTYLYLTREFSRF